ncbi:MAG: hypothetical protein ACNA8W_20865 [Bradymonadaceae bacterium]
MRSFWPLLFATLLLVLTSSAFADEKAGENDQDQSELERLRSSWDYTSTELRIRRSRQGHRAQAEDGFISPLNLRQLESNLTECERQLDELSKIVGDDGATKAWFMRIQRCLDTYDRDVFKAQGQRDRFERDRFTREVTLALLALVLIIGALTWQWMRGQEIRLALITSTSVARARLEQLSRRAESMKRKVSRKDDDKRSAVLDSTGPLFEAAYAILEEADLASKSTGWGARGARQRATASLNEMTIIVEPSPDGTRRFEGTLEELLRELEEVLESLS